VARERAAAARDDVASERAAAARDDVARERGGDSSARDLSGSKRRDIPHGIGTGMTVVARSPVRRSQVAGPDAPRESWKQVFKRMRPAASWRANAQPPRATSWRAVERATATSWRAVEQGGGARSSSDEPPQTKPPVHANRRNIRDTQPPAAPTRADRIRALRLAGKGYKTIARELGVTRDSVRGFCRRAGLVGAGELLGARPGARGPLDVGSGPAHTSQLVGRASTAASSVAAARTDPPATSASCEHRGRPIDATRREPMPKSKAIRKPRTG